MRNDSAFATRCQALPRGHWHCEHGHLEDCPAALTCAPLPAAQLFYVIVSARLAWVFRDEPVASAQQRLLLSSGAPASCYWRVSAERVRGLLANLADDVRVEDCR